MVTDGPKPLIPFPDKPTCFACGGEITRDNPWNFLYCSNACKQRVYRYRKKGRKETTGTVSATSIPT